MQHINDTIVEGGLDKTNSYHVNISKYNGGNLIKYKRRLGGRTVYSIRDYIINNTLINNDHESKSLKKSTTISPYLGKSKKYKKKKVSMSKKDTNLILEIDNLWKMMCPIMISNITKKSTKNKDINIKNLRSRLHVVYNKPTKLLIKESAKIFKLTDDIKNALQELHESLTEQYLYIIHLYNDKFPGNITINTKTKTYSSNYTPNLANLKNYIIKDTELSNQLSNIQGYCPYEPIVRLQQLLDFPIENLANKISDNLIRTPEIALKKIQIPEHLLDKDCIEKIPNLSDINAIKWYSKKITERLTILQPAISFIEKKYNNIAENILNMVNILQENLAINNSNINL